MSMKYTVLSTLLSVFLLSGFLPSSVVHGNQGELVSERSNVEPAIQVVSSAAHSIVLLNGFMLVNSASKHYTFQTYLDAYLLKGNNTLKVYIKPKSEFEIDNTKLTLNISMFSEKHGVRGYSHYSSHDEMNKKELKENFLGTYNKGKDFVRVEFDFHHPSQKQELKSSAADENFNIMSSMGMLSRKSSNNGNYHFSQINTTKLEDGYYIITASFELLEDRDYTAIYTADDIPFIQAGDDQLYNKLDPSLVQSLREETQKAFEILKQQDWEKWNEYLEPMVSRFQSNPLFEGIMPPGMSADVEIDAAINNMSCDLLAFPDADDKDVTASVLFQNKLAFIPGAIYYDSTKYNYSKSVDMYFAYENGKWVISYVKID